MVLVVCKKTSKQSTTLLLEVFMAYIPPHYLPGHYLCGSKVVVGAIVNDSRQLP